MELSIIVALSDNTVKHSFILYTPGTMELSVIYSEEIGVDKKNGCDVLEILWY